MAVFTISLFAFSLLGIVSLFALKSWEARSGRIIAAQARQRADMKALELKMRLMDGRQQASKIVPFAILLSRYLIHEAALGFAASAHFAAAQANRLADFVSHKHRFERQAPRSEFLKQVSEYSTPVISPVESQPLPSTIENTAIAVPTAAPVKKARRTTVRTPRKKVSKLENSGESK